MTLDSPFEEPLSFLGSPPSRLVTAGWMVIHQADAALVYSARRYVAPAIRTDAIAGALTKPNAQLVTIRIRDVMPILIFELGVHLDAFRGRRRWLR